MDDSTIWPDATKWAEQPETLLNDLRSLAERIQKRLTSKLVFIGDEADLRALASESNLFFRRLQAVNAVTPMPVNRERMQSAVESAIAHVIGESQARSSMAFALALSEIETEYNAASEWVRLKQPKAKRNAANRGRKKNMPASVAEEILIDLLRKDPPRYAGMGERDLCKAVGCSRETLRKLPSYQAIDVVREELQQG